MTTNRYLPATAIISLTGLSVFAQFERAPQPSPDRISLSYRPGFNITARFTGLGGFPSQSAPGPATGGGQNRTYDDGFNKVDSAGNAGGMTWYWGYSGAPGQLPGNNTIVMHSSSAAATGISDDQNGDPQHGFELSYDRRLGEIGKCPWGLELAFNFMNVTIQDNQSVSASVSQIADAYGLGGITPPAAPYTGTFSGPGPMISDSPTRTISTIPGGSLITGKRELNANVWGWRLGPYIEIPLDKRISFSLSGGLSTALVDSDFDFNEVVTIPNVGSVSQEGATSNSDFLWGGYVSGALQYSLRDAIGIFAGVQFQDVGKFSQSTGGKTAELDLGKSLFVNVGMSYSF